jgi:nucleotide-binding universal stress UspA family protein
MAGILVGVDGSDESKTALRWAVEEARLRRTALRAVYAWSPPYVAATGLAIPLGTVQEIQRDAEELLEAAFAEVGTEGVEVERAAVREARRAFSSRRPGAPTCSSSALAATADSRDCCSGP